MTRPSDPTVEAVPLSAALRTALAVALHEAADPLCSGEPPYGVTQAQAESIAAAVMRMPLVLATLDRSTAPDEGALRDEAGLPLTIAAALDDLADGGPCFYCRHSDRDHHGSAFPRWCGECHCKAYAETSEAFQHALVVLRNPLRRAALATPKDEPDAPPHSQLREALEEAIEGLLATPRPPSSGPAEGIKAWELAHWRLVTAYGAYRGDHAMCPVPSSVTGQPCLLRDGHPQDSAARFHRYAAATPKDEPDAPLDVAWREVEAALPEGWGIALSSDADPPDRYRSTAGRIEFQWPMRIVGPFYAETPVAALRALRAALSEDSPHG